MTDSFFCEDCKHADSDVVSGQSYGRCEHPVSRWKNSTLRRNVLSRGAFAPYAREAREDGWPCGPGAALFAPRQPLPVVTLRPPAEASQQGSSRLLWFILGSAVGFVVTVAVSVYRWGQP